MARYNVGALATVTVHKSIPLRVGDAAPQGCDLDNQFKTRAAQEFYLKASETLRRLDIAVLTERRQAGEQVPKYLAEGISRQISIWLRTAFERFLDAESPSLMGIKDLGEFKHAAIEAFRGILHVTVKQSIGNNSPLPPWAEAQVIEGWNVPTL